MIETVYKYETHCHTAPVSGCAKASVKDTVQFYKKLGYELEFIRKDPDPKLCKYFYSKPMDSLNQ